MKTIYLDHNATAPLDPLVAAAISQCQQEAFGNPASQHWAGRRARQQLEAAREGIAAIVGMDAADTQVIFTSGGTEANNLALLGLGPSAPSRVLVSAIEHPSVLGPAAELERQGCQVERIRVDRQGVIEVDHLQDLLRDPAQLVSIVLAGHETGVIQPIARAADLCHEAGALLHTDATQAVGRIPVDLGALGADALTFTAHKMGGPKGVGGLALAGECALRPISFGGFQEHGARPGTVSVPLVVGMHRALELATQNLDADAQRMARLRDDFEQRLASGWGDCVVNSEGATRLPQTSNVAFVPLDRQALVVALDMAGVATATGSACASGSPQPSPSLVAMGLDEAVIGSSIRLSFGRSTDAAELGLAADRILASCKHLKMGVDRRNLASTPRESATDPV